MRPALALPLVVAIVVAGCAGQRQPTQVSPDPSRSGDLLALLQADPAPALDGAGVQAWLDAFVQAHHPRVTGSPDEKAAADDLAAQLQKLGYQVERRTYAPGGSPSPTGPLQVVLAIKKGTTLADRLIVVGAHYDTAPIGTATISPVPVGAPPVFATYDDGSGTAMVMELARLLARVSTTHTLELAFFNGEEEGVLASTAYARELAQQGARVDAYLGFDMVGIAYPSKAGCLCIYADARASEDLVPLEETVAFSLLREPRADDQVQVFPKNDRNSDEASFVAAGFPTLRWSGLRHAGDYWAYHKLNDTMDTVLAEAGGAPAFDGGLESTSATAYYTALALDHRTD